MQISFSLGRWPDTKRALLGNKSRQLSPPEDTANLTEGTFTQKPSTENLRFPWSWFLQAHTSSRTPFHSQFLDRTAGLCACERQWENHESAVVCSPPPRSTALLKPWGWSCHPGACLQNGICLSSPGNYDKRAKTDTGQDKPLYLRASTA